LLIVNTLHYQPATPAAKSGKGNQQKETPVPPPVKNIRGSNDKHILQLQAAPENKPVKRKNRRQKYRER
jgi:hypothetical protein